MSDEQTVAIVSFTGAIKREIVKAKKLLARDENLSYFTIRIEAKGRIDGDVKITFAVGDSEYSTDVSGNNLEPCIEELLRRRGWQKRNDPLMLTTTEQQRADADRVFTPPADEPF